MRLSSWLKTIFTNTRDSARLVDEVSQELLRLSGIRLVDLPPRLRKAAADRMYHAYYNRVHLNAAQLAVEVHMLLISEGFTSEPVPVEEKEVTCPVALPTEVAKQTARNSEEDAWPIAASDTFGTDLVDLFRRAAHSALAFGYGLRSLPITKDDEQRFGVDMLNVIREAAREAVKKHLPLSTITPVSQRDAEVFGTDLVDCTWRVVFDELARLRDLPGPQFLAQASAAQRTALREALRHESLPSSVRPLEFYARKESRPGTNG